MWSALKKARFLILVPLILLVLFGTSFHTKGKTATLTANEVVARIKQNVTCEWQEDTVDTFKGGNPDVPVTGIATTFLATMEVLKKAKAQGLNLIITHEPTFYNHLDATEQFEDDKIVAAKKKFIADNDLVVFRFHDHIHRTEPDGIYTGVTEALDWERYAISQNPYIYKIPETSLRNLSHQLKLIFPAATIRVVGDPNMSLTHASLVLGAPGAMPQIRSLQRDDVDVMIGGETHEWETVEYVRDAVNQGEKKALILIGHANSEEAGMDYCAKWLKTFVSEVPVTFIPAGDPFWSPK